MRRLMTSLGAVTLLVMAGCSTTNTVSQMEGRGTKVVYNAPFDPTWRAAIDAAQQGDLHVINADPATGYISAKRGVHMETFGENVGIWVSRQGPTQTGVEVVSRQSGPPVLWLRNWEKRVQQTIAANLTREGVGYAAPMSGTISGGTPQQAPVYVAPPPVTTLPPAATYSNSDNLQSQIDTLQQRQYEREQELKREQDLKRRAALQDDIDMLKSDLQKLQQRLRQLEQEQRNTQ